ncbi:MAG: putative lyase [Planctomycetaceae bacterium]|nr:putative lyase [Planctomycetaceae bacterium]
MLRRQFSRVACHLSLSVMTLCIASFGSQSPANGEDKPGTVAERLVKTRADLKSTDTAVRKAAVGGLVHNDLSETLTAEIHTALGDKEGEIRALAATATGNLGAASVPAIPALIKQLKTDSLKEARETAARALGRIGKAAPTNKTAIEPLTIAAKEDADAVTRTVALGALALMDVHVSEQIEALRKFLHHDDPMVRMKASHALGMIGLPAKAAAPEIVKVLEQESDHHRTGYIARALGNTGDPASLPALYAALKREKDPGAQGEMKGAISKLGGKVP